MTEDNVSVSPLSINPFAPQEPQKAHWDNTPEKKSNFICQEGDFK